MNKWFYIISVIGCLAFFALGYQSGYKEKDLPIQYGTIEVHRDGTWETKEINKFVEAGKTYWIEVGTGRIFDSPEEFICSKY